MQNYTEQKKEAFYVIGYEIETNSDREQGEIAELWHKFVAEKVIDQIPHKTDFDIIGLYSQYHPGVFSDDQSHYVDEAKKISYSYLLGCRVDSLATIPTGMTGRTVPASNYVHFVATGDFPKSVIKVWKEVWKLDLKRTFDHDFEVYGAGFQGPEARVDIFVGIQ